MNKQTIPVKLSKEEGALLNDINILLAQKAKLLGKKTSWFQFAKKTKHGYRFLTNKEKQFQLLEEIAELLAKKHRSFTMGQIVDMISQKVNEV